MPTTMSLQFPGQQSRSKLFGQAWFEAEEGDALQRDWPRDHRPIAGAPFANAAARIKEELLFFEGRSMFHRFLLAVVAVAALAIPKDVDRTLTNADIADMVQAGLAESTIVRAIELAARRGATRFETSPQALVELKRRGATPTVLDAMLATETFPKRVMPSTAIPGLPAERGLYYRAGNRWVDLPSVVIWPEINRNWRGMTLTEDRHYVIAGAGAGLRVREPTPAFYVRGMSPRRVWQLVRLDTKKKSREWRTVPAEVFRSAWSIGQREVRAPELEFRAVAHDLFELRPATALEPGQYAITMLVPGQRWLVEAYEFAVAEGLTR